MILPIILLRTNNKLILHTGGRNGRLCLLESAMSRRHRRRKWREPTDGAVSDHREHTAAAPLRTPLPRRARSALSPVGDAPTPHKRDGRDAIAPLPPAALPRVRNAKKERLKNESP